MPFVSLLSIARFLNNATGTLAIQTVAFVSLFLKASLVHFARLPLKELKISSCSPFNTLHSVSLFCFLISWVLLTWPPDILEYSNIAWPNPSMWTPTRPAFKYATANNAAGTNETKADDHSHSPSKTFVVPPQTYNPWSQTRPFPLPQAWQSYQDPRHLNNHFSEPFTEPTQLLSERAWNQRNARSSREDIPMPDYSSSSAASSRVISSGAGSYSAGSYEQSVHMDDDQYNMLIQALTPTKVRGVHAPSNTPSGTVNIKSKKEVILDDTQETPKKSAMPKQVGEAVKENSREVSGQNEDEAVSVSSTL